MKTLEVPVEQLLLPRYAIDGLTSLDWIEADDTSMTLHADDFVLMLLGTRGSASFTDPRMIRYGSNTTCYQIFSPKLPLNHLFLGDGGSGVLGIDNEVIAKCRAKGINPLDPKTRSDAIAPVISTVVNLYTHYHFDHLHFGVPLTGLFHANCVKKRIIGGGDPQARFRNTFKRPEFPRGFDEMENAYEFIHILDPRSEVIVLLPDGQSLQTSISEIERLLDGVRVQLEHNGRRYHVADCLIVRCYPTMHPDPCISFRFENYNARKELVNCVTFMTDHDISAADYDARNKYFRGHVDGSDVFYIDGQYDDASYVPGFGHGRVEMIGQAAASLQVDNVVIGHHAPDRWDCDVDRLIEKSRAVYRESLTDGQPGSTRIIGASDRMMIFIPDRTRGREGVVFGRMEMEACADDESAERVGEQDGLSRDCGVAGFREVYRLQDCTQRC